MLFLGLLIFKHCFLVSWKEDRNFVILLTHIQPSLSHHPTIAILWYCSIDSQWSVLMVTTVQILFTTDPSSTLSQCLFSLAPFLSPRQPTLGTFLSAWIKDVHVSLFTPSKIWLSTPSTLPSFASLTCLSLSSVLPNCNHNGTSCDISSQKPDPLRCFPLLLNVYVIHSLDYVLSY